MILLGKLPTIAYAVWLALALVACSGDDASAPPPDADMPITRESPSAPPTPADSEPSPKPIPKDTSAAPKASSNKPDVVDGKTSPAQVESNKPSITFTPPGGANSQATNPDYFELDWDVVADARPNFDFNAGLETSNSEFNLGLDHSSDKIPGLEDTDPVLVANLPAPQHSGQGTRRINEYQVVLGADETLKIPGLPGELRVWIGSPKLEVVMPEKMVQDTATVPAVGDSARVEAFAPAFIIDPQKTECIKIHPAGSEVRFKIYPQREGTFEVGATVFLFESDDCTGPPIPRTASSLQVLVEVSEKDILREKLDELWEVLWGHFVDFWGALLVLLFGLVLFLIRGKLKRWFGFDDS